MISIRPERLEDQTAVYALNLEAFESSAEAKLVDRLRERASPYVSMVAVLNQEVIGHILFSPVSMVDHLECKMMGLAPMAVRATHQNRGIGGQLIQAGLEACRILNVAGVIVLGHAEYYPKFGFVPAVKFGISTDYEVLEELFMAMELQPEAMRGVSGRATYHPVFADL